MSISYRGASEKSEAVLFIQVYAFYKVLISPLYRGKQPETVTAGRQIVTQEWVPSIVKIKILYKPEIPLLSIISYHLWVVHFGIYTGRCQVQKN